MGPRNREKTNFTALIIVLLSGLGIILSLYLTYIHYTDSHAAFCTAGTDCDFVRQSGFAMILGIPVAALGVLGYAALLVIALVNFDRRNKWIVLFVMSLAGLLFSVYLTFLELFVIKAMCMYCVASAILITLIFLAVLMSKKSENPGMPALKTLGLALIVAAVVIPGSALMQADMLREAGKATPSDPFQTGLAKYLGEHGAVMYGSFKCPHCLDQKKMFGDAFSYIKYVECHPDGKDANPSLCFARGINHYPTWEINGSYYEGAMSLQKLSEISGYESPM